MKNYHNLMWQLAACLVLCILDRVSKSWALSLADSTYRFHDFLSFQLLYNRGISWGMLDSSNTFVFVLLSLVIICLVLLFIGNTFLSYQRNQPIFGQLLVITGALSNIIDRFVYGGVIDFIVLSYNGYSWPVFNGADAFIVIGIGIIFIKSYKIS